MPHYGKEPQHSNLYYAFKQKVFVFGISAPVTGKDQIYAVDEQNAGGPKTANLIANFLLQYGYYPPHLVFILIFPHMEFLPLFPIMCYKKMALYLVCSYIKYHVPWWVCKISIWMDNASKLLI